MGQACQRFLVLQGEEHSSTKEYYTTYFSMIEVQCKDCGEVLGKQFEDSGDERKYVNGLITKHRAPNIEIEWLNEQAES